VRLGGLTFAIMRKPLCVILALVALGTLIAGYPLRVLVLSTDDGIIVLRVVEPKDTFLLGYLHSVELSDVWERFVIDSDYRIVLTETMFQGQGAGLPASLSGGEQLTREGKWFRITGMQRVVPYINWRVGARWHNRFRYRNEDEQDISKMLGDALVSIQVQKMRVFHWFGYRLIGLNP
jgi:hypothetical protein